MRVPGDLDLQSGEKLLTKKNRKLDLHEFMALLGRFSQIKDDYQNLSSAQVNLATAKNEMIRH